MDTNSNSSTSSNNSAMYQEVEDDEESSTTTEDNEDVETVKTAADLDKVETEPGFSVGNPATVHRNNQDEDTTNSLGEDDEDIDQYFNDLFPDRNRLDTVEEVTEPMSSFHESLPLDLDLAKISNSGQPSSDFMNESLPPDLNLADLNCQSAKNSMTLSVTSREEFCSVSEVEVVVATWPAKATKATGFTKEEEQEAMTSLRLSKTDDEGCQETNSNAVSDVGAAAALGESAVPAFKKAAPESIADSEDSLSISLPSEGPSNPFSEVRAGILKIFDEASADQANKVNNQSAFNIEEPEDFPSFDNVIFDEKHEFEKTEKMISSSASTSAVQSQTATSKFAKNPIMSKVASTNTWSSEDQPDDRGATPFDIDSGIDGAQSRSSSSKDKVWTKIHKQLNRRFGGSTGSLSSTSPISEREASSRKAGGPVESPTDGGDFQGNTEAPNVAIMKSHIKELIAQLSKAEDDKEKIAKEAYNKAMEIKREADKRLEDAHACQMKQANLIERLKVKVVDYKEQCQTMENRLLEVNLLANQSQLQLNDTTNVIKSLEERLKTTEDRHFAEVKALQTRLEEQQSKNQTLTQVNAVQREQLEVAQTANQKLNQDIQRLTKQWEEFSQQLREKKVTDSGHQGAGADQELVTTHQTVGSLWKEILDFRRQITTVKMSTERDLMVFRDELNNTGRKLTTACVDVWSHTGSQQDSLSIQLEKVKLERKSLEQKVESLTKEATSFKTKYFLSEESVKKERQNVVEITETYEHLKKKTGEQEKEIQLLEDASRRNVEMEHSLQDIAQLVEDEVDEVDLAIETNHSPGIVKFSSFESPNVSVQRRGSTPLGERRRTRSASPAITDTPRVAVGSVQAALHKRQLQLHELKTRIASYSAKIDAHQKAARAKDDLIEATLKQLEKEKLEVDSMKLKLDEAIREKSSVKERLESLTNEKIYSERKLDKLQEDLAFVEKEKSIMNETNGRASQELKTVKEENDRLESTNRHLNKENKERINLISQLETVGSSLREQLLITKEELKIVTQKFDNYKSAASEPIKAEAGASNLKAEFELDERLLASKKREDQLENNIITLEKNQVALKSNCHRLESNVKKLNEEKIKLSLENNEQKLKLDEANREKNTVKERFESLKVEKNHLDEQLKSNEEIRDNLEVDIKRARAHSEELTSQLTKMTLEKESCQDELHHMRTEVEEIRGHLQRVSNLNAGINKDKNELIVKTDTMLKEIERLQKQVASALSEKAKLIAQYDDIEHELNDAEASVRSLNEQKNDLQTLNESYFKQIKTLKCSLEDEIARAELEKAQIEMDRDGISESLNKSIKKLKEEILEAENDGTRQKEDLKQNLTSEFKIKLDKVQKEKNEDLRQLKHDLDETLLNLESLRKNHCEEVLLIENANRQSLAIAQQDQRSLTERLNEALSNMDEINREFDRHRREATNRLEKDRTSIAELQIEVSKLRHLLSDKENQIDDDKKSLLDRLNHEKQTRVKSENEIDVLTSTLKIANAKEIQLQEELRDTREKVDELQEFKQQNILNLRDTQKKLDESKLQIERLEHIKISLNENVQILESEKQSLATEVNQFESKTQILEHKLYETRQEMETQKLKYNSLFNENRDFEEQIGYWQSRYDDLQGEHSELSTQHDKFKAQLDSEENAKIAESTEIRNLRLRLSELTGINSVLEKEMSSLKTTVTSEEQTLNKKISTLNATIDEIRARERKLEDQRHNLEICLSNSQQETTDLHIQLNGQEGRMGELFSTMARLEGAKKDLETQISNVASLLHHVRSSSAHSTSRSRPSTPNRSSRASNIRSASFEFSSKNSVGEIDFEQIKGDIRDLVGRISQAAKDRDESLHQVASLKRQNDQLLENTVGLEEKLSTQKKKSRSFEDQLRKVELKVAHSDANLADQEDKLEKRETELRQLSARLETTKNQLETLRKIKDSEDHDNTREASLTRGFELEKRQLQADIKQLEAQFSHLENLKRGEERENQRLQANLSVKDQDNQNLKIKCDNLGHGVSTLEDKCNGLEVTVDNLNVQLEKSLKNESDLHDKVGDLSQTLNLRDSHGHETEERLAKADRNLERVNIEKDVIQKQLETSQASLQESKKRISTLETELEEVETAMHKSESKVNQLELSLYASKASLENNAADNFLREELVKLRKDNQSLQVGLNDMTRKLSRLETDKRDLERKIVTSTATAAAASRVSSPRNVSEHVRSQIPLLGGRSPISGSGSHAHGESLVKVRLLEEENQRLMRKIKSLEQQLSDIEILHGKRVTELLNDRRREREKENGRQREVLRQLEGNQNARDKIFKERIQSLEHQTNLLKDQLSKEIRRRQTLITESSSINNEISELRQNLDQSLFVVNEQTDGRTLDREASRLNSSVDKFGPDYISRLTPSKLGPALKSSTPKYHRRNLQFDDDI